MSTDQAPIFFVGVPRSGTTVTFEQFAAHPDLAWVSNYANSWPRVPALNLLRRLFDNRLVQLRGKKDQFNDASRFNDYLPQPYESYRFWSAYACSQFEQDYLLGIDASSKEAAGLQVALDKIRRYQGRSRITAKMTGPGRIRYLNSVWDGLIVVHIVRDGLEVVRSLLNVNFWKKRGGYEQPWWQGGVSAEELGKWQAAGREPGALAALQWRRIIETTRAEAAECGLGNRYIEVRYEDFCARPAETIAAINAAAGLVAVAATDFAARNQVYNSDWDEDYRSSLIDWMDPLYSDLGYRQ